MTQADRNKSNEEIERDLTKVEDPPAVVNYTIGMIAAFIILVLVAVIAIGIYYSSSNNSEVNTGAGQSEKRANP